MGGTPRIECEWYDRSAFGSPLPCTNVAEIILRCLDKYAEGPDREARFEWRVCRRHAMALRREYYDHADIVVESEEPMG